MNIARSAEEAKTQARNRHCNRCKQLEEEEVVEAVATEAPAEEAAPEAPAEEVATEEAEAETANADGGANS